MGMFERLFGDARCPDCGYRALIRRGTTCPQCGSTTFWETQRAKQKNVRLALWVTIIFGLLGFLYGWVR